MAAVTCYKALSRPRTTIARPVIHGPLSLTVRTVGFPSAVPAALVASYSGHFGGE